MLLLWLHSYWAQGPRTRTGVISFNRTRLLNDLFHVNMLLFYFCSVPMTLERSGRLLLWLLSVWCLSYWWWFIQIFPSVLLKSLNIFLICTKTVSLKEETPPPIRWNTCSLVNQPLIRSRCTTLPPTTHTYIHTHPPHTHTHPHNNNDVTHI